MVFLIIIAICLATLLFFGVITLCLLPLRFIYVSSICLISTFALQRKIIFNAEVSFANRVTLINPGLYIILQNFHYFVVQSSLKCICNKEGDSFSIHLLKSHAPILDHLFDKYIACLGRMGHI